MQFDCWKKYFFPWHSRRSWCSRHQRQYCEPGISFDWSFKACQCDNFTCLYMYNDYCIHAITIKIAAVGSVPGPFDCYLANRGLKTLHVRMRQHEQNAFAVARFLLHVLPSCEDTIPYSKKLWQKFKFFKFGANANIKTANPTANISFLGQLLHPPAKFSKNHQLHFLTDSQI